MTRYLLARIAQAIFVVWAAFTLAFIILYALPGDAVTQRFSGSAYIPPEQLAAIKAQYGVGEPLLTQYFAQLFGLLRGDLGVSIATGMPVEEMIGEAFPHTLSLAALALMISLVIAIIVAFGASLAPNAAVRQFFVSLPAIGSSLPGFWVGLVLLWLFAFTIPIFPPVGNAGFLSLVLPALTMSIHTSSAIAQVFIRSLDEEWALPYADSARAKGLGRWAIQTRHVLRNALIPVVTSIAMNIGSLLAGTVVSETIFSRNGIGRLTQTAVEAQDTAVVQAVVIVSALIYAIVNLATDLIYPVLDPRVRVRRGGQ